MTGRIARGGFFTREDLLTSASREHAVGCSSRADAVIDIFYCVHAAVTHNDFQWAGNPKNFPFPLGNLNLV